MTRTLVIGDPQAPFGKLLAVLDHHGALRGDRLASDVVLISIGDHFDYDLNDWDQAGQEGLRFLRWLASHDDAQVKILLGNHDASRVMELVAITDERFAQARAFARSLDGDGAGDARFLAAFPELPTRGLAGRDYASFLVEQRTLVMELLLAGRFQLALAGTLPCGRDVLLTHAGVTHRELAMLGVPAEPRAVAAALQAHLTGAVDRVRADWARGLLMPLSLEPLHQAGVPGEEGGGLLYHRPTNPEHAEADRRWLLAPARPRRFDPPATRTRKLPRRRARRSHTTSRNGRSEPAGGRPRPHHHRRSVTPMACAVMSVPRARERRSRAGGLPGIAADLARRPCDVHEPHLVDQAHQP